MTIIAWDGKTLAADKQSTSVGYGSTVTKLFRVPGGIVGFIGKESHAMALLAWFKDGRIIDKWPRKDGDDCADAVFVDETGLQSYSGDGFGHPARREDKFCAFGAGRDYALAAMYLGHGARRAVEVACALDTTCGCGIDTLELLP